MAITKIQSESMNLADTYAFTGTVTGAGGITDFDQWKLGANKSHGSTSTWIDITADLERMAYGGAGSTIGTGMTESSGIFSFPSTGYWLIMVQAYLSSPTSGVGSAQLTTVSTNDDFSSEDEIGVNRIYQSSNNNYTTTFSQSIIDVTDLSNHKVKFYLSVSGDGAIEGSTNPVNSSRFAFYKLGET